MLEVKNLVKRFGGLVAIDNVTFKINEGEIVGLIGPNGAGKTTLFNLITSNLRPDAGSVIYQNVDITGFKPHRLSRLGICRTFQIPRPFKNLTVLENIYAATIALGKHFENPRHEAMKILELIGLQHVKDRLAGDLNLGELKLMEIGRSLAVKPKLLLLDEPFAGVGVNDIPRLVSLIKELHEEGLTLVIIEHMLRVLMRLVERVCVLDYGKKIAEGAPVEISRDKKVIEAYLGGVEFA